jgi:hypothetical protein
MYQGVNAAYVDVSDVISFPVPSGIDQGFYIELSQVLAKRIGHKGSVPVITGKGFADFVLKADSIPRIFWASAWRTFE